jgi:homopolymeric O-antigen transport system permease protein
MAGAYRCVILRAEYRSAVGGAGVGEGTMVDPVAAATAPSQAAALDSHDAHGPTGDDEFAGEVTLDLSGEWTSPRALFAEVWGARDLLATLARKEFFVKYRRASFGVMWAVVLPLVQAIVMAVVFSYIRTIKSRAGISFPVFVFTGMTAWSYFSSSVVGSATSIVDGAQVSSRIYFPRAIMPLVIVRTNLYSLPISVFFVIVMALIFGVSLDAHVLLLIPAVLLLVLITTAFALTLSAMQVYFRDIRYIVQAVFTALIYMTPVFLPLGIYPKVVKGFVLANPATGCVELFRLAIGGADSQWPVAVAATGAWAVVMLVLGVFLHCRRDRVFVDLL